MKIQCGCGQRYAFDVEPVNGFMPFPVACPICGADGTAAANQFFSQNPVAQAAPAVAAAVRAAPSGVVRLGPPPAAVRVAASAAPAAAPAQRRAGLLPGQLDRTPAENEARAKILWGDEPGEVVKFLMRQGIDAGEAQELVGEMFRERAKTIRRNGVKKGFLGIGLISVPIVFLIICLSIGVLLLKLLAVTIMVGLYGCFLALKGTIMFFAPKSEPGDVSEQ